MKKLVIEQTKNYDKFNFLPFNRDYKPRTNLQESLIKYGWLDTVKCAMLDFYGKKKLYILDGQNRFATAMFMEMPIQYTVIDNKHIKTTVDLVNILAMYNATGKPWKVEDFINAYCHLGYLDYQHLQRVRNKSNLSYFTLAGIYTGQIGNADTKVIKNGNFKITRKENGNKIIAYLKQANNVIKFTNRMSMAFGGFVQSVGLSKFNNKKFCNNLAKSLPLLEDAIETIQYKKVFEKVYNK